MFDGGKSGVLQKAEYTSTHSTFTVAAGAATFILDFLSPVSSQNYKRQSAPFSYLTVSVQGQYGSTPKVQIYSDIDNTWLGQFDAEVRLSWGYTLVNDSTSVFTLVPGGVAEVAENNQMAAWGTAVYCTRPADGSTVTEAIGERQTLRGDFADTGRATGSWEWGEKSVEAFSHDLGQVGVRKNVTFAIGYWRQAAVNYLGSSRTAYFTATCKDPVCGCVHVLDDFADAGAEARRLDGVIAAGADNAAGSNYSDYVTLFVRQAYGAMDITVPEDSLDSNNVLIFLKEISSDGNVNTIDVMFPMAPMFYTMAPDYIRLLLEPVMLYLASGRWPDNYTIHDIGSSYPNATGHDRGFAEPMPIEECGNLLTLAYMYQQATGDRGWTSKYHGLFQEYAEYLVQGGLYPTRQLSSDDGVGDITNQTTLAIKAAVALNAFGEMTGQRNYSDIGKQFATVLYNHSVGTDAAHTHFTCIQGEPRSWSLEYNLYMDVLLGLETFPWTAAAMQSAFYPGVREPGGVPLDSLVDWGKTDWMTFAAATAGASAVGRKDVMMMFVDDVWGYVSNKLNDVPFSDKFHVRQNGTFFAGEWDQYKARPVVAGHFAIMALDGPGSIEL